MNQLLIAKNILLLRQQNEITQEQLAQVLGVTKAAVSKWEKGQSLPDILTLPRIATYFNVSIDDLLGFSRQLNSSQIHKVYQKLTELFATSHIDEALTECQQYIKDYYHCYPLLVKIVGLYVNHLNMIINPDTKALIISDIINLCHHIEKHSDHLPTLQETKGLLAITYIINQQPKLALEEIGEEEEFILPFNSFRSQCYSMLGEQQKADRTLQVGLYQTLINLNQLLSDYLPLQFSNFSRFEETYFRSCALVKAFNLEKLHPHTTVRIHYAAALGYIQNGKIEQALEVLNIYTEVIVKYLFPLQLKGDDFFTAISDWFKEMDILIEHPRDPSIVKLSVLQTLEHPAFASLKETSAFTQLQHRLNNIII